MWTVAWPDQAYVDSLDVNIRLLAEKYAVACLQMLTLQRVGQAPVTLSPAAGVGRRRGWWASWEHYAEGIFYTDPVYPAALDLKRPDFLTEVEALALPGPIAAVTEVRIGGAALPADSYRVENGSWLVRIDGAAWPEVTDGTFTVTYLNSYTPGALGEHAAGVMAVEWARLLVGGKGSACRLPPSITNVSRQGLTYEVARGMFPDGMTGIPEIDAFIMLYNPFGLKVAPRVYSPDLPVHRQVWP